MASIIHNEQKTINQVGTAVALMITLLMAEGTMLVEHSR
jgi:hypothetical protein